MSRERWVERVGRAGLHLGILALGLAAIVGSGGGGALGLPDLSCLNNPQGCGPPPPPPKPTASLAPQRPIVQVGTPLVFSVTSEVTSPSYRWCWQSPGAGTCVAIEGASGPSYHVAAANLAQDGAILQVTVAGGNGEAVARTLVAVSSMPPVMFTDGEVLDRDWSLLTLAHPPLAGLPALAFGAMGLSSGGNPGAQRLLRVDLPLELRAVSLFNLSGTAVYNPTAQGAVYWIEFSLDCITLAVARGPTNHLHTWLPLLEQGGRRFTLDRNAGATCFAPGWFTRGWFGLDASGFRQIDGPACAAGETCPDFSSQGLPMRLGLTYEVEIREPLPPASAASAPHFEEGFDNFKATVWRR